MNGPHRSGYAGRMRFACFKPCLVLLASLVCVVALAQAPRNAPQRVPDTMAQRVLACSACHGKEGVATNQGYYPRIAGKPAGYLFEQLGNFRAQRRNNAAMAYLLENMTEAYLLEIAQYFSALDLPYPPPQGAGVDPSLLVRGRQLVLQGDVQRGIPPCTACHGAAMTGRLPATPGLLGLPRDYVVAQIGAWKTGQRKAEEPDCMAQVAKRLSMDDIHAVSHWLSSQPVPGNGHPAPATRQTSGIACRGDAP